MLRRMISFDCMRGGQPVAVSVAAVPFSRISSPPKWLEALSEQHHSALRGGFVASRVAAIEAGEAAVIPNFETQQHLLASRALARSGGIGVSYSHEVDFGAAAVWPVSSDGGEFAIDLVDVSRMDLLLHRRPDFSNRWLGASRELSAGEASELWGVREVVVKLVGVNNRAVSMRNVTTARSSSGQLNVAIIRGEDGDRLASQGLSDTVVLRLLRFRESARDLLAVVGYAGKSTKQIR